MSTVNTFIGRDWTKSVDDNWPRFLEVWPPLIQFAEQHGVRIGIENCPMFFTGDEWPGGKNLASTPADLAAHVRGHPQRQFRTQLRSVPHGLAADGLPQAPPRLQRPASFTRTPRTCVSTNTGWTKSASWPTRWSTTRPNCPVWAMWTGANSIRLLTDVGYDGPICIEVEDRAYEGSLERRKASLRQSGRYLRQFMP